MEKIAKELVELAKVMVAGEKEKRPDYRKPVYQISDGIIALKDAAEDAGDKDIMKDVQDLHVKLTALMRKLNTKYLWD